MNIVTEKELVKKNLAIVKEVFSNTLNLIPLPETTWMDWWVKLFRTIVKNQNSISSFKITNSKVLPYGLPPHTRSISWIAEQVIKQQTKFHAKDLGLTNVEIDFPDTSPIDCSFEKGGQLFPVNIKVYQLPLENNRNDIASLTNLYKYYKDNPESQITYVCFGFKFDKLSINFSKSSEDLIVFSPQLADGIYINSGNNKIQFKYRHDLIDRTREDFLALLSKDYEELIVAREKKKQEKKMKNGEVQNSNSII